VNSKDFQENLIFAQNLIDNQEYEKALFFVEKVIENSSGFFKKFIYRNFFIQALSLKIEILFKINDFDNAVKFILIYKKYIKFLEKVFPTIKVIFESKSVFDKKFYQLYLTHYIYDRQALQNYIDTVHENDDFDRNDLSIFKRYCLDNKKNQIISFYTLKKLFKYKDYDLKFITLGINYFYNQASQDDFVAGYIEGNPRFANLTRNEDFLDTVKKYVSVIRKKRGIYRNIFYPIFRFYYDNTNDESILPVIFLIVKKNKLHDYFAEEVARKIFYSNNSNYENLKTYALIKRLNNDVEDEALDIYSKLYKINPKEIENTKYLVKVLRGKNLITEENIDIFLKAYSLFNENEKNSDEYISLIKFLSAYLEKSENFDSKFSSVVEDILRICKDYKSYLYAVEYYFRNALNSSNPAPYEGAYFLISRLDISRIPDKLIFRYCFLYVNIFINHAFYVNFMEFDWKKVFVFLKKLKNSGVYNVDFLIAQFYILRKNRDYLPQCFFNLNCCSLWNNKCVFMEKLDKFKNNLSYREHNIIKKYIEKSKDEDNASILKSIFIDETFYIPIVKNYPISYCANIQKSIKNKKYEHAFDIFKTNPHIENFKGFKFWGAVILFHMKRFNDSIILLNTVLKEDSKNAYAYFYRGMCFYRKNYFIVAFNDFNNAVKLKLYDTDFLGEIIKIYISRKKLSEAQKLLNILDNNDNSGDIADEFKAEILFYRKKFSDSYDIIKKSIEENENISKNMQLLEIKILIEQNEFKIAIDKLLSFVESHGENDEVLLLRANANFGLKEYRLVKKDLMKISSKLDSKNLYLLSLSCFHAEDSDNALKFLKKYREKIFFDIKYNILLSKIYLRKNLNKKAMKILRFTWIISKNKEVLLELININNEIENVDITIEYCEKYLKKYDLNFSVMNIYLNNLITAKKLHLIELFLKKYSSQFDNFHKELKITYVRAFFITGEFYSIIEDFEDFIPEIGIDRKILKEASTGKFIYLIEELNDGNINIFVFKGNILTAKLYNIPFNSDYFVDNIDLVFVFSRKNTIKTRLKYFSKNIYNFNRLLFMIFPDIRPQDFFADVGRNYVELKKIISNLKIKEKSFLLKLDVFDSFLLEFFKLSEEHYELIYENFEKFDNQFTTNSIYKISTENTQKKILCMLKMDFVKELIKLNPQYQYLREFLVVHFWLLMGRKNIDINNILSDETFFDLNFIDYFYEKSNCKFYDKCPYRCEIKNMLEKPAYIIDFKLFDIIEKINSQVVLKDFNNSFLKYILFDKNIYDFECVFKSIGVKIEVFNECVNLFKYNNQIFSVFKKIMAIWGKINKNSEILFNSIKEYRGEFFDSSNIFPDREIFYKNGVFFSKLNELIAQAHSMLLKEQSFSSSAVNELMAAVNNIIYLFRKVIDGNVLFGFPDFSDNRFLFYVKEENNTALNFDFDFNGDSDDLSCLKEYYKIEMNDKKRLNNEKHEKIKLNYNSIARVLNNSDFYCNSKLFLEKKSGFTETKLLNQILNFTSSEYFFRNWSIKEILNINIILNTLFGKKSIIFWENINLQNNFFYGLNNAPDSEKGSTIIISDYNKLSDVKDIDFMHFYFIDFSEEKIKKIKKLKYQKIFYNISNKRKNYEKLPYAGKKLPNDIVSKKTIITENSNNNFLELNKYNNFEIENFYNLYLKGGLNKIKISRDISVDFFKLTDFDFEIYREK